MIVRIFPSERSSSFRKPGAWIPDGWTINDPIHKSLVGVLEVDEGLRLISEEAVLMFDSETLEMIVEDSE